MNYCRTYWGSHACDLKQGHDGPHLCSCVEEHKGRYDPETREYYDKPNCFNVGAPPYYGEGTKFFGQDAEGG